MARSAFRLHQRGREEALYAGETSGYGGRSCRGCRVESWWPWPWRGAQSPLRLHRCFSFACVTPAHFRLPQVGNSLGGFSCLYTAAHRPDLVRSLVLLNSAGRFESTPSDPESTLRAGEGQAEDPLPSPVTVLLRQLAEVGKRAIVHASFLWSKQPLRIAQVLRQVYADQANVDAELIESIRLPADDPNAAEVFYRIISSGGKTSVTVNQLVGGLKMPLLLLWGDKDPWIRSERAETIKQLYRGPRLEHVRTLAGHCPHDDLPEVVNGALESWLASV